MTNLWKAVGKDQMIQHKLKVEIFGLSRSKTTVEPSSRPELPTPEQAVDKDPYEDYDSLLRRYTETQRERDDLQRELQRLKDQFELIKMKNSSVPREAGQQAQGYQVIHLLLVGLVALVIGAFLK